jgi:hypothetical protein
MFTELMVEEVSLSAVRSRRAVPEAAERTGGEEAEKCGTRRGGRGILGTCQIMTAFQILFIESFRDQRD